MSRKSPSIDRSTLISAGATSSVAGVATTPALTIVYHPRLDRVGDRALLDELGGGRPALLSRAEPDFTPSGTSRGAPLGDEHLSRKPIRLLATHDGGVRVEIGDSSTGVVVRGRRVQERVRFSAAQVRRGVVLALGHRVVLLLHAVSSLQEARGAQDGKGAPGGLVGESDALRKVLWEIRSVADLDLPVLLRGETGSGKELVARAIHDESPRRSQPFVAVNLGAIAPTLAVAELFGAERGAFTGAVRKQEGYFERARGGTLFLDEIGEAPIELQVALLRALETGELQSVGGSQVRKADVRVLAATDADLEALVARGAFRAPLLNRLSAYEIRIPPLRERRDDIGRLLVRFLREELERIGELDRLAASADKGKPWLPASLVARLADHDWPGNIRQLRNVVRQCVIGSRGRDRVELTPAVERLLTASTVSSAPEDAAQIDAVEPVSPVAHASREAPSAARRPADITEAELEGALRASRWDFAAAAQRLGISRASIYLLIERCPRFRTAADLTPEEIVRCHRECGGDLGRMALRLEVSQRALARWLRQLGIE
jgi:DNA-binding NtrC family response regulator